MSPGTRYGVVAGCAVQPVAFSLLYGYQSPQMSAWSPWLWILAPVTAWVTVEAAGRVWSRARWLGKTLLLPGLLAAGVWWWWIHGLLTWGDAAFAAQLGLPTVVVLAYLAAATLAGRSLARQHNRPQRAMEPDPVSQ